MLCLRTLPAACCDSVGRLRLCVVSGAARNCLAPDGNDRDCVRVVCVGFCATPRLISHPYSVARPKRMIVFHNHIFQPATLQMPGALPTMDLAKSTVMLSRFDPSPHALYVEAFQAGAKTIEYGNLELDEPSEISDYTTWQGYFPFSAFLDGVQWEDLPAHPAYSDRDTTPSLVLVSDEKFSDNVRPTHALPEEYVLLPCPLPRFGFAPMPLMLIY